MQVFEDGQQSITTQPASQENLSSVNHFQKGVNNRFQTQWNQFDNNSENNVSINSRGRSGRSGNGNWDGNQWGNLSNNNGFNPVVARKCQNFQKGGDSNAKSQTRGVRDFGAIKSMVTILVTNTPTTTMAAATLAEDAAATTTTIEEEVEEEDTTRHNPIE